MEEYAAAGCPAPEGDPEDPDTTTYQGPCTAADGSSFSGSMSYGYEGAEPVYRTSGRHGHGFLGPDRGGRLGLGRLRPVR